MRKSIIAILMTFCLSIMTYAQTPRDRATELKEQAQSSLNQKDYIKARYLIQKGIRSICNPRKLSTGNRMWCSGQRFIRQRELLQRRIRTLS